MASMKQLEQKVQQKVSKRDRLKQEIDASEPKSPKRKRLQDDLKQVNADIKALKDQVKTLKSEAKATVKV